jgi:hypothetical protein
MNNKQLMAVFITYRKYYINFLCKNIKLLQEKEHKVMKHSFHNQFRASSICLAMTWIPVAQGSSIFHWKQMFTSNTTAPRIQYFGTLAFLLPLVFLIKF